MKIFITKFSILISSILVSVIFLVLLAPRDQDSYYSGVDDKILRLNKLKCKKIILVGGSNLTFGIDSERIEKEFDLPVVNMSLHGGLGLEFMLRQITNNVKNLAIVNGDIIIISPEYSHLSSSRGDAETIYGYILNNKNINDFSMDTILYHYNSLGKSIFDKYKQSFTGKLRGYSKNFNEYGDMIGHLGLPNQKFSHSKVNKYNNRDIDPEKVEILSKFIDDMNSSGIKAYLSFPSISKTAYDTNREFNEKVANIFKLKFKNITISDNKKYVLDDDLFFDTQYHLNYIGRNKRTDYLINDLHSVLIATHH